MGAAADGGDGGDASGAAGGVTWRGAADASGAAGGATGRCAAGATGVGLCRRCRLRSRAGAGASAGMAGAGATTERRAEPRARRVGSAMVDPLAWARALPPSDVAPSSLRCAMAMPTPKPPKHSAAASPSRLLDRITLRSYTTGELLFASFAAHHALGRSTEGSARGPDVGSARAARLAASCSGTVLSVRKPRSE